MSLSEASAERATQLPSRDEAGKLWVRKDGWYEAEDWWFSLSGLCDFYAYAIDLMGDLRGRKVLDCGCGGGHTSVMLAKHGAQVTAVDLSADVLVKARRLAEVNGVEIDFRQSSLEELDLPDESFDYIFGSLISPCRRHQGRCSYAPDPEARRQDRLRRELGAQPLPDVRP